MLKQFIISWYNIPSSSTEQSLILEIVSLRFWAYLIDLIMLDIHQNCLSRTFLAIGKYDSDKPVDYECRGEEVLWRNFQSWTIYLKFLEVYWWLIICLPYLRYILYRKYSFQEIELPYFFRTHKLLNSCHKLYFSSLKISEPTICHCNCGIPFGTRDSVFTNWQPSLCVRNSLVLLDIPHQNTPDLALFNDFSIPWCTEWISLKNLAHKLFL